MTSEEILKIFKIGDIIIINKQPSQWSSHFSELSPLRIVTYPYECEIKKIETTFTGSEHVAIFDGKYGWSLSTIIDENCINHNKYYRQAKLQNIIEI